MAWLFSKALMDDCENSRCSPGQAAASLAGTCSDGGPCAPSSTTPTPQAYLWRDRTTDAWSRFPSGMKCAPLTDGRGADVLTWYLAAFPARTSAQQDEAPESAANGPDSGWKWRESSVKYDPDSRLWKTRQCLLLGDSEWFSEIWPRWGLMRDGECWELPMSARPSFARGSGLFPTIRSTDGERGGRGDLIQAIRGNPNSHYRMFPTPTVNDSKNNAAPSQLERNSQALNVQAGGSLNPTWVEWLMGWPLGWTDCAASATDKFRQWRRSHGEL